MQTIQRSAVQPASLKSSQAFRMRFNRLPRCLRLVILWCSWNWLAPDELLTPLVPSAALAQGESDTAPAGQDPTFQNEIAPWLTKYCADCHNEGNRESGIRVDNLDGSLPDESLRLWEVIRDQVRGKKMPPEDQPQPNDQQRETFEHWVSQALHLAKSRPTPRNGSMRRLTVSQYERTLKQLLGIQRNLTDTLPPDPISKDGFTNQATTLVMNPMQLEAYFKIAEDALQCALVDPDEIPVIHNFRMDLGKSIHPSPSKESLILGANNHLLANRDFIVTEPEVVKGFQFKPFRMQKKFRFIEGYQGNDTVRGWRDFEGIEHAVFACMRGNEGYPKGKAYEMLPSGLALRPAIPSPEIFGESSTYGPQANFKLSLRELPERGRFQVRVTASKADDPLLVDPSLPNMRLGNPPAASVSLSTAVDPSNTNESLRSVRIPDDGVYMIQVHSKKPEGIQVPADDSKLQDGLLRYLTMEDSPTDKSQITNAELTGKATWTDSPFGRALSVDGQSSSLVQPFAPDLSVGTGEFTVAAWIHPQKLAQGGIVCLGGYNYTHGWVLDMPDNQGVLRIETAKANRQHNGSVQTPPGAIKKDAWQHVCAVVRRGDSRTELFINGYRVAVGTIQDSDLTNPSAKLHIGRVENAQGFHGQIDEVRIYNRALGPSEIRALMDPGKELAKPPEFNTKKYDVQLSLSSTGLEPVKNLQVAGQLTEPNYCIASLSKGQWKVGLLSDSPNLLDRAEFHRIDSENHQDALEAFTKFQARNPKLGVHLGLRRDCGSTLSQVGAAQIVSSDKPNVFVFEGDIGNFPAPEVEPDNVNYLAGIREIGVRHEYTDGREMPRLIVHRVEFEGPFYETWPPESHRHVFLNRGDGQSDRMYAQSVILNFGEKAFRRPLSDTEKKELMDVYELEVGSGKPLGSCIKETLLVILTSPQFLYITETSQGPEPESLDDWELASKLSYFLWNGPPDELLLQLAHSHQLRAQLDAQIDRMIQDPRSQAFAERFVSEWMSLDKFDVVEVDAKRFPHLTRDVRKHLRREPIEYFRYMLSTNAQALELIRSDHVVANEVVASYYGLGDRTQSGFEFVPIKHGVANLGGVLTQAALLSGLSDGREGNPVKRGAWFARRIIAQPPDDPPPNVPKLEDLTQLSLREKLQRHRDVRGCAQCHAGIDPWGLPFEQFDASGRLRTGVVDSATKLGDGTDLPDFEAFRGYLERQRADQVAFSLAKHLAIYASGRSITYNENQWIRENLGQFKDSGYRINDLLHWIIHSDLFDKK